MGNRKRMTQILVLLAILFLGGMYYLYTLMSRAGDRWPFYNEPGTLTNDISGLESAIAQLQRQIAQIEPAREKLAAIKVEYELATRVLPRENSPDQLLAAIRLKAQQSGVTPDSLVPAVIRSQGQGQSRGRGRAAASGSFEEWSFTLRIRGSYDQIATFVNRMEEFESSDPTRTGSEKRFFKVTNIDISAEDNGMSFLIPPEAEGSGARQGHQCTLVMSTYRYSGAN